MKMLINNMPKMSDTERTFIKQLKITLISVLGPFMLLTIGSMINDHYKIKNNTAHIKAMEETVVSKEIMMLYLNDQRKMVELLNADITEHTNETDQEMAEVNGRLDQIMRDIYEVKKRGFPDGFTLK